MPTSIQERKQPRNSKELENSALWACQSFLLIVLPMKFLAFFYNFPPWHLTIPVMTLLLLIKPHLCTWLQFLQKYKKIHWNTVLQKYIKMVLFKLFLRALFDYFLFLFSVGEAYQEQHQQKQHLRCVETEHIKNTFHGTA